MKMLQVMTWPLLLSRKFQIAGQLSEFARKKQATGSLAQFPLPLNCVAV
jgi:hypothetical protein